MIKGMAKGAALFQRPEWLDSASRAADLLLDSHLVSGRLHATSRDGKVRLNGYLDDYAYLVDALLELLQASWRSDYLGHAITLTDNLIKHFEDPEHGGFFFTADDHETLVHRPKPLGDDAMPSGNGVAIEVLQVLAVLTGNTGYQDAAERALRAAWPSMQRAGYAHVGLLEALRGYLAPPEVLIVRGPRGALDAWRERASTADRHGAKAFFIPNNAAGLPPALASKAPDDDKVVAYRCRGTLCEPPFSDLEQL